MRRIAQWKLQKFLVITEKPAHRCVSARRRRDIFAPKQPDFVEIFDFLARHLGLLGQAPRQVLRIFDMAPHFFYMHPTWAVRGNFECVCVEISRKFSRKKVGVTRKAFLEICRCPHGNSCQGQVAAPHEHLRLRTAIPKLASRRGIINIRHGLLKG